MRCKLHREVPALDHTLCALSFACGLHIDELANLEMSRSEAVPDGQKVLRTDFELCQVSLSRQVVLHEVANLWLFHLFSVLFSAADLNSIESVLLLHFDLNDLAPINLDNRAGNDGSPLVPKMRHSDFIAN
jgi:hypothetical protein